MFRELDYKSRGPGLDHSALHPSKGNQMSTRMLVEKKVTFFLEMKTIIFLKIAVVFLDLPNVWKFTTTSDYSIEKNV